MRNGLWGWCFKCQSDNQTLSVITAIHKEKNAKSCSIQLITDSALCRVLYNFKIDGRTLIELEAPNAAFEYEYQQ